MEGSSGGSRSRVWGLGHEVDGEKTVWEAASGLKWRKKAISDDCMELKT